MHWYQWLPTIYWLVAIVVVIVGNARRFMRSVRWLRKAGGDFLKERVARLKERVARLKERVKRLRSFPPPTKGK